MSDPFGHRTERLDPVQASAADHQQVGVRGRCDQRRDGLVGQLLKDREFGERTVEHFDTAVEKTTRILDQIERGTGKLGTVVSDQKYARDTLGVVKSAAGRPSGVTTVQRTSFTPTA